MLHAEDKTVIKIDMICTPLETDNKQETSCGKYCKGNKEV